MPLRSKPVIAATVALATGLAIASMWRSPSAAVTGVEVTNRPVEVPSDGYVTASTCVECHQDQHRSWHTSFHRTMTQKLTPETAPRAIQNTRVEVAGKRYEFSREGDRYYVRFDDPIEPGGEVVRKELVLMTGSHHMHVFWYESPFLRTPALLPIVHLIDDKRWILRNSAFIRPPELPPSHELGRWNDVCSSCHSTHPRGRFDETTREWDTHVVDFGIACEACHGPGEAHVALHRGEAALGDRPVDDIVVNPDELPHHLQSDVCGQCHSVQLLDFDAYDQDKYLFNGVPFRPGDNLEDSELRQIVRATPEFRDTAEFKQAQEKLTLRNNFWTDGTVRVSGREFSGLIESPCFEAGQMSCLSCHEMHPDASRDLAEWRDDQLKPGMRTNLACTQCHKEPQYNERVSDHTHHAADSHGSQCMNCHMPHTTYGLLKTIRSHRIESPSAVTTLQTGRPNGCVLCHLDQSIGWAAEHLSDWYGQPKLELNPTAREVASGPINMLLGDAGLRAIHAATFAWEPAREASGTDWMAPYLLIGLLDEYDACRIIAKKSLRTLPGWEDFEIDELGDPRQRAERVNRELARLKQELRIAPQPEVLFGEDGAFQFDKASELFQRRDRRPILLEE